jgi:hypothetical protein
MEKLGSYWTDFHKVLGVLLKSVQKMHVWLNSDKNVSNFPVYVGLLAGSGEEPDWFQQEGERCWWFSLTSAWLDNSPYLRNYADKEDSLSSAYLLPRHYIQINHKVYKQLAFMLTNGVSFNADKPENWNDIHLLTVLIFDCAIKHNIVSEHYNHWHNPV